MLHEQVRFRSSMYVYQIDGTSHRVPSIPARLRLGLFLSPSINEELREPPYRRSTPRPLLLEAQPLI